MVLRIEIIKTQLFLRIFHSLFPHLRYHFSHQSLVKRRITEEEERISPPHQVAALSDVVQEVRSTCVLMTLLVGCI